MINNLMMLENTLDILENGGYLFDQKEVALQLSPNEMKAVRVFLQDDIDALQHSSAYHKKMQKGSCVYDCENIDSFSLARKRHYETVENGRSKRILVLNLANPVHPGGGVRRGARAQEEDLCRKSSLLLSLESEEARKYYAFHQERGAKFSSDSIIVTPNVEIMKDEEGELLAETVVVSVMTCAAPIRIYGLGTMTQEAYETLLYRRICGMLRCAAHLGYEQLILGAFGCGAFGNDAALVASLFHKAFCELDFHGFTADDVFFTVDFAVLAQAPRLYNYEQFYRYFGKRE